MKGETPAASQTGRRQCSKQDAPLPEPCFCVASDWALLAGWEREWHRWAVAIGRFVFVDIILIPMKMDASSGF